jgi:hypothetical protein
MNRFSRTFAAVAATTTMLSAMVPALAAEGTTVATYVSAMAAPITHRRLAIGHVGQVAAATPLQRDLGCSGEWCGRQFVLMIGIGF